jgi:asparagine synthetase B (glutamine-hydrolysing)
LLKNRGPDYYEKNIYKDGIFFHSTVLWQQGKSPTIQPMESNDKETIAMFNGDLYMECNSTSEMSDSEYLFDLITKAQDEENLLEVFRQITGPFSLVIYFKSKLYFARDSLEGIR